MPTAAVLAGIAGLLVELAVVSVAVAELFRLLTLALTLDPSPLNSELRLLAMLPVAVASTLEMLLAREAASEVMEATSEDTSESLEEILEPTESVTERLWPEVKSEPIEAAAEVAPAMAEERSEDAVCRIPPGSADTVLVGSSLVGLKSWAETAANNVTSSVEGRILSGLCVESLNLSFVGGILLYVNTTGSQPRILV